MKEKYQKLSLTMSAVALLTSIVTSAFTGYLQYQARQDAIREKLKVELRMTLEESPLSPLDLRMLSGVAERQELKAAILITNTGSTNVRILEVGYQDFDLPLHAFYAGNGKAKILSPGEQEIFEFPDLVRVNSQLLDDIKLGGEKTAKVFAVSTRANRFEAPAIIEVAK